MISLVQKQLHGNRFYFIKNRSFRQTACMSSETVSFSGKSIIQLMEGYLCQDSIMKVLNEKFQLMESVLPIKPVTIVELSELGEPLVDLGYKKVYKTNIATLVTIPVWEKQRTLRPSRSRFIAEEKLKSHNLNVAGIISAYFHPKSNDFGIIDGQHRLVFLFELQVVINKKSCGIFFIELVHLPYWQNQVNTFLLMTPSSP